MENMNTKVSLKLNFLITKMRKQLGWHAKVFHTKRTPGKFRQLKLIDEKHSLDTLPNMIFGEVAVGFFHLRSTSFEWCDAKNFFWMINR